MEGIKEFSKGVSRKNYTSSLAPFKFPCPCNKNIDICLDWDLRGSNNTIYLYDDGDLGCKASQIASFISNWKFRCDCRNSKTKGEWVGFTELNQLFLAMSKASIAMA